MAKINLKDLLTKYDSTIKEEINIKDISFFDDSINFNKTFKPIGSKLSAAFGKDTSKIIQYGKQGNIKILEDGKVEIFDDAGSKWILEHDQYEIAYDGLAGDDIAIDQDLIIKLDLEISPELKKEGVAREISRFLNQMRKDANYSVDDKLNLIYDTQSDYSKNIMNEFGDFFKQEALIKNISEGKDIVGDIVGDIVSDFENENEKIKFALKL